VATRRWLRWPSRGGRAIGALGARRQTSAADEGLARAGRQAEEEATGSRAAAAGSILSGGGRIFNANFDLNRINLS
jgi:hypothetical protein